MKLDVVFSEHEQAFAPSFGEVQNISDGGFDRGYAAGRDNALANRTDLTVTENGEYIPLGDSTGFKSVIVNVQKYEDLLCDSGSFVLSTNSATVTIQHKLDDVPHMFYILNDTQAKKSVFAAGAAIYSPTTSAYMTQGLGYNSSGAATALTGSNNVVNATSTEVTLKVHAAYALRAGETYYWMVAKPGNKEVKTYAFD